MVDAARTVGVPEATMASTLRATRLEWSEGRNLTIEYRWTEESTERLSELANELVRLKVAVIVTHNTPGPLAAKQATSTIPIVFATAGDPVGTGIVASLAQPLFDSCDLSQADGRIGGAAAEQPDADRCFLRKRSEWPDRRTAKPRDELAPSCMSGKEHGEG